MGPYYYIVEKIDGDYALLARTDTLEYDTILVALALLPQETDEKIKLVWENLSYRILED